MKRQLFTLGMLTVFTCAGLFAADLQAKIPFDFSIGQTAMPAGDYYISLHNSLLSIRAADGHNAAMALTNATLPVPKDHRNTDGGGALLFKKYGNESFLTGFWMNGADAGQALPEGKRQKELARRIQLEDSTAVAMARK